MLAESHTNLLERIEALATLARETEGEQTPEMRGARIITELFGMYGYDEDDPETLLRDALADIRHTYDLLPESSYHVDERAAHAHYIKEKDLPF